MSSLVTVNGDLAPVFLDDGERTAAQNTQPAKADLVAREVSLANQIAHQGRPVFTWYSSQDIPSTVSTGNAFRQVYLPANLGAKTEAGITLGIKNGFGWASGQGFNVSFNGTVYTNPWNYSGSPGVTYPQDLGIVNLISNFGTSTLPAEMIIGGVSANWPSPRAGNYWQNPTGQIEPTTLSAIEDDDVHAKGPIVGVRTSNPQNTLTALAASFRDTWFHQRPQIGWSYLSPGQFSSDARYINFNVSSQNYRYIFNQAFGAGSANFGATAPAITLPLANAGGGRRTQLRVYVFVYACMSGATNTGSIGVANKNAAGTMATSATVLTNGVVISGSTFAWYPTLSTWTPGTGAYFTGYTGSAFDRVALCAKSSGATDTVHIGAWTMIVAPSTT